MGLVGSVRAQVCDVLICVRCWGWQGWRLCSNTVQPFDTSPPPLTHAQVYYPYLLMNKKRYAGLLWTKPDKWDKMDSKVCSTFEYAIELFLHLPHLF